MNSARLFCLVARLSAWRGLFLAAVLGWMSPRAAAQLPTVSIEVVSSPASEAGPTNGLFRISRTGSTNDDLVVSYNISGTALNGVDYERLPGMVTIPAGETSAVVAVVPIDDDLIEPAETVNLALASDIQPFSIVILPDTQNYVCCNSLEFFTSQIDWIISHRDSKNIAVVLQEGDCTDGNTPAEWVRFKGEMTRLDGVVPYVIAVGNHDGLGRPE